MKTNTYSRQYLRDNLLIIEDVVETEYPINKLPKAEAKITEIGCNGGFRFILNKKLYESVIFTNKICTPVFSNKVEYYEYSEVELNFDVEHLWSILYKKSKETTSWRSIDQELLLRIKSAISKAIEEQDAKLK